jgi:hypothetical protein
MGNFSKDAGTDAKADKNLKTSGKLVVLVYLLVCSGCGWLVSG